MSYQRFMLTFDSILTHPNHAIYLP